MKGENDGAYASPLAHGRVLDLSLVRDGVGTPWKKARKKVSKMRGKSVASGRTRTNSLRAKERRVSRRSERSSGSNAHSPP
jgi:hypothetical protein